jgi:hypothetical protein
VVPKRGSTSAIVSRVHGAGRATVLLDADADAEAAADADADGGVEPAELAGTAADGEVLVGPFADEPHPAATAAIVSIAAPYLNCAETVPLSFMAPAFAPDRWGCHASFDRAACAGQG